MRASRDASLRLGLAGLCAAVLAVSVRARGEPSPTPSAPQPSPSATAEPTVILEGDSIVNLGRAQRLAAYTVGGLGLVSLGIAAGLGLDAISLNNDTKCHCTSDRCDDTGLALTVDANQAAFVSTVLFITGGVLLATGVVLWVTSPSRPRVAVMPVVGPRVAGLSLGGAF